MLVFFRLAKAGYGTVNEIKEWDARTVLQALYFESFCYDYEMATYELMKNED